MKYFDHTDMFASISWFFNKNTVNQFEADFSEYLGIKHTIATSYGRTALYLGLKALGVFNKEVIIPAFICTVVRHAVVCAGAIPKFVDISYDTLEYDISRLNQSISKNTGAILVTHLFGKVPVNFDEIISIANTNGIPLIEDCAHALGAHHHNRKVGTFGHFSIFSLTKNTINYGGGVFATSNSQLFSTAQKILKQENYSLKKSIVDFPMVFSYGLEQIIDKAIFDRVGRSIYKWWLIKIPEWILRVRSFLISLLTLKIFKNHSTQPNSKNNNEPAVKSNLSPYPFSLAMNKMTASLARNQLRKLDILNHNRERIFKNIVERLNPVVPCFKNSHSTGVYSFIVMKFENNILKKIIAHCRSKGLLLRPTWPTHQKLWDEQATPTVRAIGENILTWTVNPNLTQKEINNFADIINSLPESQDVRQSEK